MSTLDIIQELEENDEIYFENVLKLAALDGFEPDINIQVDPILRQIAMLSLLKFRQLHVLNPRTVCLQKVETSKSSSELKLYTEVEYNFSALITELVQMGYERRTRLEKPGEFTVRGGSVDIFETSSELPVTVEFFGDEIETIYSYNRSTRARIRTFDELVVQSHVRVQISAHNSNISQNQSDGIFQSAEINYKQIKESNALVILMDTLLVEEDNTHDFLEVLVNLHKHEIPTVSFSSLTSEWVIQAQDKRYLQNFANTTTDTPLGRVLNSYVNFNTVSKRSQAKNKNDKIKRELLKVDSLEIGDYLVHDIHGIGKYIGIEKRENHFVKDDFGASIIENYLVIEYASSTRKKAAEPDFLYVAATNPEKLAKYIGQDKPRLSRFGGSDFAKTKAKVKRYTNEVAKKLIEIYIARMNAKGTLFAVDDAQMSEFERGFEYELTPDQAKAVEAVKRDMESEHAMDRLLCADVGFGKTEVALRAAFKAVLSGKQVAVLVPTTILASQHYNTFKTRCEKFAVRVEMLSRFVEPSKRMQTLKDVASRKVDILIGTHALLTPKVHFADLGLVVIDEEQRFGAMHKEALKMQAANIDVLAMSATPIPRTLEMALTGVRDISTIETPPLGRKSIVTNVLEQQDELETQAIARELERGGQVFVIHNNIKTLPSSAGRIQNALPKARVRIAHGQMSEDRIDHIIDDYWRGNIDVLVCTTIVETGLDIPNANTLIVEKAEGFGLSQLHQLRGRIGRSTTQAYAYFFYTAGKVLTETAYKRLETISDLDELGSGTAVALKDLEIRGAGNFLGAEQSGYISGVGYDLYVRLMEEAVERLKNKASI